MTPDVHAAQNEIANPTYDNDPAEEETTPSRANAADSWGQVPTKKASLEANAFYKAGLLGSLIPGPILKRKASMTMPRSDPPRAARGLPQRAGRIAGLIEVERWVARRSRPVSTNFG
jgi:hypothetical protein